MKHTIRINGQVQELDCELGSGIKDKYDVEIFEGDIVTDRDDKEGTVIFESGNFYVETLEEVSGVLGSWRALLCSYNLHCNNLEVTGYVKD